MFVRENILKYHVLAIGSYLIPVFRNQRRRLGPRLLHQRVLEPLLAKIRMLGDNQLEAGCVLLRELEQQLE